MLARIDISAMVPPELNALPEVVNRIVPEIAETARTEIVRLAGDRLQSSQQDYVNGLQPVKFMKRGRGSQLPQGEVVAVIELVGWLPNAVENGWEGGDMKAWLLQGRNAKVGKNGARYNTIPFRQGTPGTSGRNFQSMGAAYAPSFRLTSTGIERTGLATKEEARKLGKKVYAAAQKLGPGDRLRSGMAPKLRSHHKSDIYAGMVKQRKNYGGGVKQSQYSTFRRVSSNSDPQAFMHPGIEGHRLFKDAQDYAGEVAGRLFGLAMRGMAAKR